MKEEKMVKLIINAFFLKIRIIPKNMQNEIEH